MVEVSLHVRRVATADQWVMKDDVCMKKETTDVSLVVQVASSSSTSRYQFVWVVNFIAAAAGANVCVVCAWWCAGSFSFENA